MDCVKKMRRLQLSVNVIPGDMGDKGNVTQGTRVPLRIPTSLCQVEVKSFSVVDDANFAYISQLSATLARHTLNKMFLLKNSQVSVSDMTTPPLYWWPLLLIRFIVIKDSQCGKLRI